MLGTALSTLTEAMLLTGAWDEALGEIKTLTDAMSASVGDEVTRSAQKMLLALRGDDEGPADLSISDPLEWGDVQDVAYLAWATGVRASLAGDWGGALAEAERVFAPEFGLDLASAPASWIFSFGVRAAFRLGRVEQARALVAHLDQQLPGNLSVVLRAEHALARARVMAQDGEPADVVDAAFHEAIDKLRATGAPYPLAHGLLDLADHEVASGRDAGALIDEARAIGEQLGAVDIRRRVRDAAATSGATSD
jgi:hypothetical protein